MSTAQKERGNTTPSDINTNTDTTLPDTNTTPELSDPAKANHENPKQETTVEYTSTQNNDQKLNQTKGTNEEVPAEATTIKILANLVYVCEKIKGKWTPVRLDDNIIIKEKIGQFKNERVALCFLKNDHFEPVNETSDIVFMNPQPVTITGEQLTEIDKYKPVDPDIPPANLKGKKKYDFWVNQLKKGFQGITKFNITLQANDFDDLINRELTSSLMNFYLKLLDEKYPDNKFYIFNTFFFTALARDHKYADLSAVNSWTLSKEKEINIFEVVQIFVPIHRDEKFHWVLAVINLKEKRFEYCDSAQYEDNFFFFGCSPCTSILYGAQTKTINY